MQNPVVSVIVTCFNQEDCIAETLKSVKEQSYKNWECIIIDDGSTDRSSQVIKGSIASDERFRYIYQHNQGVTKSRNTGFILAKGSYINFLDGDDTFLTEKLKRQLEVFNQHPEIAICICDHQHYYVNQHKYTYYEFEPLEINPLFQIVYRWQQGVAFPLHSVLYRRNLWAEEELPYPSDYSGRSEDWIFNILIALKKKPYFFLEEVLCIYRHANQNYTSQIYNSVSSAIHAAIYIEPMLPEEFQKDFLDHTIKKSLNRYVEAQKPIILRDSGNWRLGNFLTKPLFWLKKKLKIN